MNIARKKIQDNEDPKDRQKDTGIAILGHHFKSQFLVLRAV